MRRRKYSVYMPSEDGYGTIIKYKDDDIVEYHNPVDVFIGSSYSGAFFLTEYNPDLRDAIHEMREGDELHVGEYVIIEGEMNLPANAYGVGTWDKPFQISEISDYAINLVGVKCAVAPQLLGIERVRKATEEELIEHFSNKTNDKMNNVKTVRIRESFLKDAYDNADASTRKEIDENVSWKRECSVEFVKKQHAKACWAWQTIIEEEFPQIFREDDIAIREGAFKSCLDNSLSAFSNKAGLRYNGIEIIDGDATKPEYKCRGLYIPNTLKVEVNTTKSGGTEIIFKHR